MKRYIKPKTELHKVVIRYSMLGASLYMDGATPTQDLSTAGELDSSDTGGNNLSKGITSTPNSFSIWDE